MLGFLCLFYFLIFCHEFMTRLTTLCYTKLMRESRTTELTFSTLLKWSYCGTDAQPTWHMSLPWWYKLWYIYFVAVKSSERYFFRFHKLFCSVNIGSVILQLIVHGETKLLYSVVQLWQSVIPPLARCLLCRRFLLHYYLAVHIFSFILFCLLFFFFLLFQVH